MVNNKSRKSITVCLKKIMKKGFNLMLLLNRNVYFYHWLL